MNTISDTIRRISALPDNAEISDADAKILLDAAETQPFFAAAAVVLLRHWSGSNDSERLADIRHRLALATADRRTLLTVQHGDAWTKFYPEAADEMPPQTVDVIDTFLRTYGSCTPEEEAQLERLIFNPTPDYAELLARQEQEELPGEDDEAPGSQDALINAFIRSQHPKSSTFESDEPAHPEEEDNTPVARPEHTDDSLLSESLAKIFIKQGRYERAYEIISGLNLKFPKKKCLLCRPIAFPAKIDNKPAPFRRVKSCGRRRQKLK